MDDSPRSTLPRQGSDSGSLSGRVLTGLARVGLATAVAVTAATVAAQAPAAAAVAGVAEASGVAAVSGVAASSGVAAVSGVAAAPVKPAAAGPHGSAFVWLDTDDAAMCPVPAEHQWNSTSPWEPVNMVCEDGTGLYTVILPGLGVSAGTVQVTAYGSDSNYCKVQSWAPAGSEQRIKVKCFNSSGAPAASQFTVSYANVAGTGYPLAYVFANQPTTASYTPPLNYQFNYGIGNIKITKSATQTGVYTAQIPGMAYSGGHVQVTAYGPGPEWCTAWNWAASGTSQLVQVHCYTAAGVPANSRFTMAYVVNGNILGEPRCCSPDGNPTAYAFAHNPTASSYVPAPAFRYGFSPTGLIRRLSVGRYEVDYDWSSDVGTIHVTAIGQGSRCKLESWGTTTTAFVRCTNTTGAPMDATYLFHHVGPFVVG